MTADQRLFAIVSILAGQTFMIAVFVAGILCGRGVAWRLEIAADGAVYLCMIAQLIAAPRWIAMALWIASVALASVGFLDILW